MNIKAILASSSVVAAAYAFAADPGGTPGLVKAIFRGSAFDTTSDVVSHALGYTAAPEEMYATSLDEKTTVAWAGYMHMVGGVKYNFKGYVDDFATVKVAGNWIVSKGRECQEMTGSYTPVATDWYEVEFRVANNGGGGGCTESKYYGILWNTGADETWRKVRDYGDGVLFKTGVTGLKNLQKRSVPAVLSSKIRLNDKTILDVVYIVTSPKNTVNVRALAFQDGERSFWKVVRPKTFVDDDDGNPTACNIGDGVPANTELKLSWKIVRDWDIDIANFKFEILVSDVAQLPLKKMTIPAMAKNPAMTIAYNAQTDEDIFNALLWHWANGATDLLNTNGDGYIDLDHPYANQVDTTNIRIVDRTTIVNRPEALRYIYAKMGWEPLEGGNLMNYVRQATRKDLWFNSGNQTSAIKTSTKPANLYIGEKAYCVIDVSGGKDAASYPVAYLDTEPVDGWSDEYKTTKILLRRIEPCRFMMQNNKEVTLTKPYYMGVFTITQKQYEQVMGSNPTPDEHMGDKRPVEISWNAIRGNSATYNWPTVKTVDPSTFVGKIQAKTGLNFDLPTEAQWECACRAGTSSKYNNGGDEGWDYCLAGNKDVSVLGRYWTDQSVGVGLFKPNLLGFYDMHGNVGQWCLDYSDGYNSDPAIDYVGAGTGSARVIRGYDHRRGNGDYATSFRRCDVAPSICRYSYGTCLGFRLARTLTEQN